MRRVPAAGGIQIYNISWYISRRIPQWVINEVAALVTAIGTADARIIATDTKDPLNPEDVARPAVVTSGEGERLKFRS